VDSGSRGTRHAVAHSRSQTRRRSSASTNPYHQAPGRSVPPGPHPAAGLPHRTATGEPSAYTSVSRTVHLGLEPLPAMRADTRTTVPGSFLRCAISDISGAPRNEGVRGSSPRVGFSHVTGDEVVIRASASARRSDGDWAASPGVITSFAGHRWQQGGNTTPWTSRKTIRGRTGEIGLSWALSDTDRNQPQTPRRPRNEGVRGSSPRVGFTETPLRRSLVLGLFRSGEAAKGLLLSPVGSRLARQGARRRIKSRSPKVSGAIRLSLLYGTGSLHTHYTRIEVSKTYP
jgi:hypothetical protein